VKIDRNGKFVFSTYFGGNETDDALGMAVDTNFNIHIVGKTNSKGNLNQPTSDVNSFHFRLSNIECNHTSMEWWIALY
jgi:hypothetical protein